MVMVGGVLAAFVFGSGTAGACGFLVAPNGAVNLQRTTTLASWHNGVEHYVTSFQFASDQPTFGSIIPLPGEPTVVERAGDWTLQRLQREVQPVLDQSASSSVAAALSADATVLKSVQIDSLDVTVLQGGGDSVARWATQHGFDIDPSVTQILERYGRQSPYFVAAKFDANRAKASDFRTGDGIPIHLEIPLDRPWVPLEILGAGKPGDERVKADVFLLTPQKPKFASLDSGVNIRLSRNAGAALLNDLRNDKNSDWVPQEAWLTHVSIDSAAKKLHRDLVPLASPGSLPTVPPTISSAPPGASDIGSSDTWAWAVGAGAAGLVLGASAVVAVPAARRRLRNAEQSMAA
jgi:hypothetical protein